jgi:hypothetical protein
VDLNKYTTLILVNGNYLIFPKVITKIEQWIQSGGTLIAYQDAIKWLNDNKLIELVLKLASWRQRTFHSSNRETTHKKSGAIFETQLDLSHPINFGMPRNTMPIFRNTSIIIEPNKKQL